MHMFTVHTITKEGAKEYVGGFVVCSTRNMFEALKTMRHQ